MQGGVVMDARVSAEGTVTAVTEHAPSTLSPAVVGCLEEVLKAATFTAPGGTGSSVRVPINFRRAADGGI